MNIKQWLEDAREKVQSFEQAEGLTPYQTYGIMEYGGDNEEEQHKLRLPISDGGYWLPGIHRMLDLRGD